MGSLTEVTFHSVKVRGTSYSASPVRWWLCPVTAASPTCRDAAGLSLAIRSVRSVRSPAPYSASFQSAVSARSPNLSSHSRHRWHSCQGDWSPADSRPPLYWRAVGRLLHGFTAPGLPCQAGLSVIMTLCPRPGPRPGPSLTSTACHIQHQHPG